MSDLKRLSAMGRLLVAVQTQESELEGKLKKVKAERLQLEREDLPQLMIEVGMSEFRLEDGTIIRMEEDCDARINDKTREQAFGWLIANGYGGLIKTEVAVKFGRGDHENALKVSNHLSQDYEEVELKETVHHSTLKAFVKEQMAAGTAIPMDLFNVHPYQKVTIRSK